MKSRYYKCKTAGSSECWYCSKATNWVFENNKEGSEVFCCKKCFTAHIKYFKGKSRIIKKLSVKTEELTIPMAGIE